MTRMTTSVGIEHSHSGGQVHYRQHMLSPLSHDELLVKVLAAGLNRADLMQCHGKYQPPAHETSVPGIEISGYVLEAGEGATSHRAGDKVCGVVPGGGFSLVCKMDSAMAMPIPSGWSFEEAAAFPEAVLTANEALVTLGALQSGKAVVVHAASSGMGTMVVSMAKCLGGVVIATTSHASKADRLRELGADEIIQEQGIRFYHHVLASTKGVGADLVVDFLGGRYVNSNIHALRAGGKLIAAGILDGRTTELDLYSLINRSVNIMPLTLRMKTKNEKRAVVERFFMRWGGSPLFEPLRPLIHAVFPFSDISSALALMESSEHTGKIVISLGDMHCSG